MCPAVLLDVMSRELWGCRLETLSESAVQLLTAVAHVVVVCGLADEGRSRIASRGSTASVACAGATVVYLSSHCPGVAVLAEKEVVLDRVAQADARPAEAPAWV